MSTKKRKASSEVEAKQVAPSRKIVMAVDSSVHSQDAVAWACSKVLLPGDEVTLLTVYENTPLVTVGAFESISVSKLNEGLEEHAQKTAAQLLAGHKDQVASRVKAVQTRAVKGPVKHTIVEFCNQEDPDILIMSSRGMGSIGRFLLGSVSDHCMHHCRCAVMVAPKSKDK